jgi:hypothetical protein
MTAQFSHLIDINAHTEVMRAAEQSPALDLWSLPEYPVKEYLQVFFPMLQTRKDKAIRKLLSSPDEILKGNVIGYVAEQFLCGACGDSVARTYREFVRAYTAVRGAVEHPGDSHSRGGGLEEYTLMAPAA